MKRHPENEIQALSLDDQLHSQNERITKPNSLIGLSLSECVADVARGVVKEDEILEVLTGTLATSLNDWVKVVNDYLQNDWKDFPEEAKAIFKRLFHAGKIKQTRGIRGNEPYRTHFVQGGVWIDRNDFGEWLDLQVQAGYITEKVRTALCQAVLLPSLRQGIRQVKKAA